MKSRMLSDQELLDMYQQGDREAVSQLLERHTRRVRDYVRMLVKDGDVADDLTQEVLIKVVKVLDEGRYTDKGRFLPWVLRIAHNRVLDYFRAQKQVKTVSESTSGFDILGNKNLAEPSIEDQLVSEQQAEEVRASLSLFTFIHWRRKWQPTPVFLPGESQGQRSLVGCHLWGHTESDTTEAT